MDAAVLDRVLEYTGLILIPRKKEGHRPILVLIRNKPEMNNSGGFQFLIFFFLAGWGGVGGYMERPLKKWKRCGEEMLEKKQSNHKYIWTDESSQQLQSE